MAMFPLGSVLFPYMPLPLRVFEDRYLVMLSKILQDEPAEFGVVLIERGQEVGGGEKRFHLGTVAQITQLEAADGFVGVVAQGERRIEIVDWLDEDPYPQASIRVIEELRWEEELQPLRDNAEAVVRRTLAMASEFVEQTWSPDVELSTDPGVSAWQLAGIAPLGPIDQVALLRCTSMRQLLESVIELTEAARDSFTTGWDDELEDPGEQ